MSKKCAKCQKIVYPTEELKCLDKIWHKLCFKCEACGTTLNMKNYKGFDKLPYCNAHCPTAKHTQVADTPETRRIAENTKIQSNIQYHADFEKLKGQKTSVADDPEIERVKQNTQIQSNVSYWGLKEQKDHMEHKRPDNSQDVTGRSRNPGKISDYNPPEESESYHSQRSSVGEEPRNQGNKSSARPGVGGYAPFSYGGSSPPGAPRPGGVRSSYEDQSQQQSYGQSRFSYGDSQQAPYSYAQAQGQRIQPGSITDYDPANKQHGAAVRTSYGQNQPHPIQPTPPPAQQQQQQPRPSQPPPAKQVIYKALYDYTAADSDEVSFQDGDQIINAEVVDAGWMIGTVKRTGQHGMLPSNYVERVN